MFELKKKIKRAVKVAVDFLDGIGRRQIWTYAAASAFYLFWSLIPLLGLVCSLLPYTPLTEAYLLGIIRRVAPGELYSILSAIITSIYDSSATTLSVTALASVWMASLSMMSLMRGMDAAHDKVRSENFLLVRLRACFFMVIALAAMLLTLCAIVYGGRILDFISSKVETSWAAVALLTMIRVLRFPVMMLFLFVVFLILYKWMPVGKRKLFRQWPGALFTTVAWLVFSYFFSLYLDFSNSYSIYGILGTVVVALLWMYYILFILLVGAYINKFVREEPGKLREAGLAPAEDGVKAEPAGPETQAAPEIEGKGGEA